MSYKILKFDECNKKKWNELLKNMSGSQHHYTWNRINYFKSVAKIKNFSFAIFEGNTCLALVALGKNDIKESNVFSFGLVYCPEPILNANLTSHEKRRVQNNLRTIIEEIAKKNNVKEYRIRSHPVIIKNKKILLSSEDQFYQIKFSKEFFTHNTVILNLESSVEKIWNNLSKTLRKSIKKSDKENLSFKVLNLKNNKETILNKMKIFKKFHYDLYEKQTRPNSSWNSMFNSVIDGEALLFSVLKDQNEISFLYCGVFGKFCFGWSQANAKKFEKNLSIRHFLEWSVIKYLKKNNYLYYELGERYYEYKGFKPSKKYLTISDFKEKFNGSFYPKVFFNSKIN